MPIVIACPSGHRLKVPSKYQGRRIVCPVCGESIEVPGQAAPPTAVLSKNRPAPSKPAAPKPVAPPSAALKSIPSEPTKSELPTSSSPAGLPELPPTPKPVAKVPRPAPKLPVDPPSPVTSNSEPSTEPHVSEELPSSPALPPNEPVPETAPLNMPLPESPPNDPLPSAPLFGEEAIEAASMLASEENVFPEIRIETEHLVEVDARHLLKPSDPAQVRFNSVLMLAIASILVAGFCLIPSIVEQTLARRTGMREPDTWSYVVILFATVQIAISIYAIRIPDWSTIWMMAVVATSLAAIYAAGLALTMFAGQGHSLVRQLGLLDEVFRYRAQPWCFLTMCILLTLAFCCGRYSVDWHQSEMRLAENQTVAA